MKNFDEIIDRKNTNSAKHDFMDHWNKPADVLPLWVADMDFQTAPEIIEALKKAVEHGIFGYSMVHEDYNEVISSWFDRKFSWKPENQWLVKTPGVVFAISNAVRAFTKPGDAVIIQQPVYYPFVNCVVENGRTLVNNELIYQNGKYQMNLKEFEQQIVENEVKLFIMCSPHNPVGRVWTREELEAVGEICLKHQVFVISDEIHCDFTFPGYAHTVFSSISEDFADNAMICTAPSKSFNLAGLQCSNIFVKDKEKREALERQIYLTGYDEINAFGLVAGRAAYEYGELWLEELKDYLYHNLIFVRDFLEKRIPQLKLIEPQGTYLLWVDCSGLGLSDEKLEEFMVQSAKLWLDGGSMFGTKSNQFQRINIASPRNIIQKAMEQLEKAVNEL